MKKIFLVITCGFTMLAATAQDSLKRKTLDELINQLIEANYTILIEKNEVQKAKNNATVSPFLPSISATARQNQAIAENNALSVGAQFSWRLFDGGGMFYQYKQSKELLSKAEMQQFSVIENLIADLMAQYNYIITLQKRVELGEQTVKLSRERYNEAMDKYTLGSSSGLDMKLAKTDLNADSSSLITVRQALDIAYIQLSNTLNYADSDSWYIDDSIKVFSMPDIEKHRELALRNNTQLLLSKLGISISDLDVKISRATRFPTLDFGASGNLGLASSLPADSWKSAHGVSWGFTITAPIFNGGETTRKIRNAILDKESIEITAKDVESNVLSALEEQYLTFLNNLQLIDFESENSRAMKLNLEIAMDRYRLGDLSGIDFRNIQLQYMSAKERQLATIYQAKLSQIELMLLTGTIF